MTQSSDQREARDRKAVTPLAYGSSLGNNFVNDLVEREIEFIDQK